MFLFLTPVAGIAIDVAGKVFANLFFPTQTQIHVEIFAKGLRPVRRDLAAGSFPTSETA